MTFVSKYPALFDLCLNVLNYEALYQKFFLMIITCSLSSSVRPLHKNSVADPIHAEPDLSCSKIQRNQLCSLLPSHSRPYFCCFQLSVEISIGHTTLPNAIQKLIFAPLIKNFSAFCETRWYKTAQHQCLP
jgi:hypothetical protein